MQPAPPLLVDTHVHIAYDRFQKDLEAVAARWREAGVTRLVHSCVEPGEFESMQRVADRFPELSLAVGLHPTHVSQWTADTGHKIRQLAESDARVVAIGETGLDFAYKPVCLESQYEALDAHLTIAADLGLPVIIHCRDMRGCVDASTAMAEKLSLFQRLRSEQGLSGVCGVMHCWNGTPEETQWFLDLGFFISFSGIVTFKNAEQVHASAQMVPANRLLIETDCPYLSPEPKRKDKCNEPAFVAHVAARVASLRGISVEELAQQTTQNAFDLFNLPTLEASAA